MSIIDWAGRHWTDANPPPEADANEAVERIVQVVNPRLRFARRYRARLAPAVQAAREYARVLVCAVPPARAASAAGWSADPYMRAFFANPDDLARAFGRSPDLHSWFSANPVVDGVACGAEHVDGRTIRPGVALEGDVIRHDVAQTTLAFGDYRAGRAIGARAGSARAAPRISRCIGQTCPPGPHALTDPIQTDSVE